MTGGRKVIFGALVLLLLLNLSLQLKDYDKSQWIHQSRASKSDVISTTVALTLRNVDDLQKTFEEVSSPRNPNWRKYLTKEEIEQRFLPTSETVQTVSNFLTSKGAINVDLSMKGSISAQFTVGDIEKLLKVELHNYSSIDGKQKIVRSPSMFSLPSELNGLVDVFSLISEFPALHLRSHTSVNRREEQSMKKNFNDVRQQLQTRESCNVSPNYGYPETSDTDLYSQVQIVCCNGELTTNVQSPCSEYPPALTGLYVEVKDNFTDVMITTNTLPISQLQCFSDGVGVTCNVPFTLTTTVETYQQYNLYVSELFEENQSSNLAMFPTALVTSAFVTPQLFAQYYNIPLNYRGTAPNNIQSVVEFSGQYYSPSDLAYFFGNMSLVGAPVTLIGPNDPENPGDEATLDIEWMMGVAVGVPTTFWSVGEGYLIEWTQQLLNSNNPPLVNSVSYAGNEDESPREYRDKVDQQFQLLAVRGVTFIVGSGDAGVSDIGHGSQACTPFEPQYPASSPYVTTVSATYFTPSSEAICSVQYYSKKVHCSDLQMGEVAVGADNGMDWTTGGGFSNHSPQPSYQANAVNSYLTNYESLLPPSNYFNQSNRAYPDVSSNGHNLVLILNDVMDIGDGTSAATPIFSGILALLNDWLLNNGEAPLGFVNPLLYDIAANYPSAFYDVTYGNNKCGDVLHPPYVACCPYGYETSNGWDPVTGLGTPRFNALLSALQNYVASSK